MPSANRIKKSDRVGMWLRLAVEPHTVRRGLSYAVVIGAVLIGINHYELLLGQAGLSGERGLKMALTVIVPYLVSTFSSVGAQLACGRAVHGEGDDAA